MTLTQLQLSGGAGSSEPLVRSDKTGAPFSVRPFLPADRVALEEFYEHFEPQRAAQGLPPHTRDRIARWLDTLLARGTHLIACRGDVLIGHAAVLPVGDAGSAEYAVFLDQSQRGKGVGTELNRISIDFARRAGLRRLWLSVEPQNRPAIRSYEKVGFRFRPGTILSPEPEMILDLAP